MSYRISYLPYGIYFVCQSSYGFSYVWWPTLTAVRFLLNDTFPYDAILETLLHNHTVAVTKAVQNVHKVLKLYCFHVVRCFWCRLVLTAVRCTVFGYFFQNAIGKRSFIVTAFRHRKSTHSDLCRILFQGYYYR